MTDPTYFFTSERLGFRNWEPEDFSPYATMNGDAQVMEFFPKVYSRKESDESAQRLKDHIDQYQFGYFAVDFLATKTFIGFIGIMTQDYGTSYSPFVDIGWRLDKAYWGRGLATEGARACLDYGFRTKAFKTIYAVTPWNNLPSQNVAQKIGMEKMEELVHPKLAADSPLQPMYIWKIDREE